VCPDARADLVPLPEGHAVTIEERVKALEEGRSRDAEKIDALHQAVSVLLDRAAEEPREDRFAAAARRFRKQIAGEA
jgi:hypothetical protein